jgi:ferrochelatase
MIVSRRLAAAHGRIVALNGNPRFLTSSSETKPIKTGIVMLNMGGPADPKETGPFLKRLFTDSDIIDLGGGKAQEFFGTIVAQRRTPRITEQYEKIGGSPIRKWTEYQGERLAKLMDQMRPESAPHKSYVAFRYADPLTEVMLDQMKRDGVQRAVAFSQFPHWSCTTTGSSLNELWRQVRNLKMEDAFQWSIIDRWPTQATFIQSLTERIEEKLDEMAEKRKTPPVLVFSAHSVPMKVVEKGDPYSNEVAATVRAVMDNVITRFEAKQRQVPKHILAWQSKVGYLPWMVPATSTTIEKLAKAGHKSLLVVPVAFTSDHIETLFEIDMEYRHLAHEKGIEHFAMTEGLNGSQTFIKALAEICTDHLNKKVNYSPQYKMKCLGCEKPYCRGIIGAAH